MRTLKKLSPPIVLVVSALLGGGHALAADPESLPAGAVARLGTSRFANIGRVMALAFSPDGKTLAAASWDGDIRLWDVAARKETKRFTGHDEIVRFLTFSSDGRRLISGGQDGTVRVWDVADGKEIRRLNGPKRPVVPAFSSYDGSTLVVREAGRAWNDPWTVHFWDLTSLRELGSLKLEPLMLPLAYDGKQLAVYQHPVQHRSGLVHILDVATGKERAQPVPVPRWVRAGAFVPDGRILAVTAGDTLRLWDVQAGKEYRPFAKEEQRRDPREYYGDGSSCLRFSADGKSLAAAGGGNIIHVWETATAAERCRFENPIAGEVCVAISPDGRTLASGSLDVEVLLWDLTGLRGAGQRAPDLRPDELPGLWNDLEKPDAAKAYRALWRLVAAGGKSIAYVADQLKPVPPADPQQVARLLSDLDDSQFAVRDKASRELETLGESAIPFVRAKLAGPLPSLEARRRLERVLEKTAEMTPQKLRELRAIEMLERAGTPQARQTLQILAKGVAEARLTQEARAAMERLTSGAKSGHRTIKHD